MIRIFSQYVSPKSVLLIVLEAGLLVLALVCGVRLRFWNSPPEFAFYTQLPDFAWQGLLFAGIFQICFYYSDLYDVRAIRHRNEQLISLGQSLGAGSLLLGAIYFVFPDLLIGRGVFFISTVLVALFVLLTRLTLDAAWRIAAPTQNILILGTGELALTVAQELNKRGDLNTRLVGFVEHSPKHSNFPWTLMDRPVMSGVDSLASITAQQQVSRIVVAMEDRRGMLPVRDLVRLRVEGIRVEDAQSTIASLSGRVWLRTVRPSWFVFSDGFHRSRLNLVLKRILDLSFGLISLVLCFPLMVCIALAISLDSRGPVIYRQTRVGLRGKCFEVLKFRSMGVNAEQHSGAQWAQDNDARVTRVGRFIRKFRLDELPQFVNVIRGEMSFVGPRPERPVFVERLREEISYYDERHTVRPGLTGWAQVSYQYGASLEDAFRKLEYDLFYLKNMSIFFDCAIALKTMRIVLTGHGGR
jgi:sugar transferase (PEP-CTERM system associated)